MGTTTTTGPIDFAEIRRLVDLRRLIESDLGPANSDGRWKCPFHADRSPSLGIVPNEVRYHCFGCGSGGDAIQWIVTRESVTEIEAARRLAASIGLDRGWKPGYSPRPGPPGVGMGNRAAGRNGTLSGDLRRSDASPSLPVAPVFENPTWQAIAEEFVSKAERQLHNPEIGGLALAWLLGRGLKLETIEMFRLGFLPSPRYTKSEFNFWDDGKPHRIWLPRGITIPWVAPGAWYSTHDDRCPLTRWVGLNVRRLGDDVSGALPVGRGGRAVEKCMALRGSRRGHLYPWAEILPSQSGIPLMLAEGEMDALIGWQELGHLVNVGTVGSASTSIQTLPRATRTALSDAPVLLLAFDNDSAGNESAERWLREFPDKAHRLRLPAGLDLNDMRREAVDLREWLQDELGRVGLEKFLGKFKSSIPLIVRNRLSTASPTITQADCSSVRPFPFDNM